MRLLDRALHFVTTAVILTTLAFIGQAAVFAQFGQYRPAPQRLSSGQLERLVSRIALYPDPLLAQTLAASTYADQIPDAAQWADRHSYLRGDELGMAAADDHLPWDGSVQGLIPFPYILDMMRQDMAWTTELGDAVLSQREELMDAIQNLRQQAMQAGYLQSNQQIRVVYAGSRFIEIQPVNPAFLYVPYYDPLVVYAPRRSGGYARGGISFSARVSIAGAFAAWGWGAGGPRLAWDSHRVIIGRDPWERTWSNRQSYEHPYVDARDRPNPQTRVEENHRLLQPDEQYYRRQRERDQQQQNTQPADGLGHINQEINRPR
jgi:Protein of unknown function (DUF3300)